MIYESESEQEETSIEIEEYTDDETYNTEDTDDTEILNFYCDIPYYDMDDLITDETNIIVSQKCPCNHEQKKFIINCGRVSKQAVIDELEKQEFKPSCIHKVLKSIEYVSDTEFDLVMD